MNKNRICRGSAWLLMCALLCGTGCSQTEPGETKQEESDPMVFVETMEELENYVPEEFDYTFLGFSGMGSLSFYTAEKEQIFEYGADLSMTYTGEPVSMIAKYDYSIEHIDDPQQITSATTLVFLLNDGIPQPFYWGDSEEETLYVTLQTTFAEATDSLYYQVPGVEGDFGGVVLTMEEVEEKQYYPFRFTPTDVSYGKNNSMTLVFLNLQNEHFNNPHLQCHNGGMAQQFVITADSEANELTRDITVPVCGQVSDFDRGSYTGSTLGVAITEKVVSGEQLKINTVLTTSQQLYASYTPNNWQKKEQELMLFAFMDGKPLYAFEDSWYCTMYTDSDELYEIPLSMSRIPSGEHLIGIVVFDVMEQGLRGLESGKRTWSPSPSLNIYNVTIP